MCYKQCKIAGGVGALRESDATNFFKPNTQIFTFWGENQLLN